MYEVVSMAGSRGTIHRPVLVHFLPRSTMHPRYLTMHSILHRRTTDTRECLDNPGSTCPSCPFSGTCGSLRLHKWVELTWVPFGIGSYLKIIHLKTRLRHFCTYLPTIYLRNDRILPVLRHPRPQKASRHIRWLLYDRILASTTHRTAINPENHVTDQKIFYFSFVGSIRLLCFLCIDVHFLAFLNYKRR